MNKREYTLSEILELIERYFDCSLSDEEEMRLREVVARTSYSHPSIDEVRALIGFRRSVGVIAKTNNRYLRRVVISAAATVAIIMAFGLELMLNRQNPITSDFQCVAYIDGRCITGESEVIQLITADIVEFSNVVEESNVDLMNDFSEVAPQIEDMNSI